MAHINDKYITIIHWHNYNSVIESDSELGGEWNYNISYYDTISLAKLYFYTVTAKTGGYSPPVFYMHAYE